MDNNNKHKTLYELTNTSLWSAFNQSQGNMNIKIPVTMENFNKIIINSRIEELDAQIESDYKEIELSFNKHYKNRTPKKNEEGGYDKFVRTVSEADEHNWSFEKLHKRTVKTDEKNISSDKNGNTTKPSLSKQSSNISNIQRAKNKNIKTSVDKHENIDCRNNTKTTSLSNKSSNITSAKSADIETSVDEHENRDEKNNINCNRPNSVAKLIEKYNLNDKNNSTKQISGDTLRYLK